MQLKEEHHKIKWTLENANYKRIEKAVKRDKQRTYERHLETLGIKIFKVRRVINHG